MEKTNVDFWIRILKNPSPLYKELFNQEARYIHDTIPQDSSVLDIGCGNGRIIRLITQNTQNVTGIDNDAAAIANAAEVLKAFPQIRLIQADGTNMPFEDETFDAVTFMMTLVNFGEAKEDVLREIHRVLKKDGLLILSVYSEDAYKTRLDMYTEIGLPIKTIEEQRKFIFDTIGSAESSEQFTKEQLLTLLQNTGFAIDDLKKIDKIAYLCTARKV